MAREHRRDKKILNWEYVCAHFLKVCRSVYAYLGYLLDTGSCFQKMRLCMMGPEAVLTYMAEPAVKNAGEDAPGLLALGICWD